MATKKVNEKSLTRNVPLKREVTVYAVFLLGGNRKSIDTEDVAIKVSELAPGAFSWRKYPEQVNLELVRAMLSDAKKPIFGALLHGTGTSGWRLSDAGVKWVAEFGDKLFEDPTVEAKFSAWAGSSDARRNDREVARIKGSLAWKQWQSNAEIEESAAKQLFRIDDYVTPEMTDVKISRVRSAAIGDPEIAAFLLLAVKALDNRGAK